MEGYTENAPNQSLKHTVVSLLTLHSTKLYGQESDTPSIYWAEVFQLHPLITGA